MAFTRASLDQMSEDELREEVLIPLFRAMAFRDVRSVHGGVGEQGKDIVMWKVEDPGRRVNYAVVAKATKITGSASRRSSAAEVRMQVDQCFGAPYSDPVTAEDEYVDRCWVVTSKQIGKNALRALQNALKTSNLLKDVTFIDGDKLLDMVRETLPEASVLASVQDLQKALDEGSAHYRLTAHVTPEAANISVEPRYPGAEVEHPLSISVEFRFPDTPEGRQVRQAVDRHMKTGIPVSISDAYIAKVELPESLRRLLGPMAEKPQRIAMGPDVSRELVLLRIELEGESGELAALRCVRLHVERAGTEEITLGTPEGPAPARIRLRLNFARRRLHLTYSYDLTGANALAGLEAVAFLSAMAEGGILRLKHIETGLEMGRAVLPAGGVKPQTRAGCSSSRGSHSSSSGSKHVSLSQRRVLV